IALGAKGFQHDKILDMSIGLHQEGQFHRARMCLRLIMSPDAGSQVFIVRRHTHFRKWKHAELIVYVTLSFRIQRNAPHQQTIPVHLLVMSFPRRIVSQQRALLTTINVFTFFLYSTIGMPGGYTSISVHHLLVAKRIIDGAGKRTVAIINFALKQSVGMVVFPSAYRPFPGVASKRLILSVTAVIPEYSIMHVVEIHALHLNAPVDVIIPHITLPSVE